VVKAKDAIKRESYSVRLDPELITELKHIAVDERKPVSILIEEGIKLLIIKFKTQIGARDSSQMQKR
jgi:predicted transcriptional regulator